VVDDCELRSLKTRFLIPLVCAAANILATAHPVGNVNRYLSNSARTDLIGPDMWTILSELLDGRVGRLDTPESGRPGAGGEVRCATFRDALERKRHRRPRLSGGRAFTRRMDGIPPPRVDYFHSA
jgi:hypothetical protein